MSTSSMGKLLQSIVQGSSETLLVVGVFNAISALLAQQAQHKVLYLSGSAVATVDYGLPDLALTTLTQVSELSRKITQAVPMPLLVDADTGWGNALNVSHTVKTLESSGAAGLHLEDQAWPKRCGHRSGKQLITSLEMQDKLKSAVDARVDDHFVIMARTDALGIESFDETIERARNYVAAGADMLFIEAVTDIAVYQQFIKAIPQIPILANITEFGQTPLYTQQALTTVGVHMMLFPLTAFRVANYAMAAVYQTLAQSGTQQSWLPHMQSRTDLYDLIDYEAYEAIADQALASYKKET